MKKASILLFGISFLIAILGEVYLLNMPQPHILSIITIGIVVILTGYLFFDSIWEYISSVLKSKRLLWDERWRQNEEERDTAYTELLNIQKATYSALKKSDIKIQEDIKEISDQLTHIIQLQNKAMDGQKKALNISVNYSKEHTKELIQAIKEECKGINYEEQLSSIISLLQNYQNSESDNKTVNSEKIEEEKAELEISPLYDDPNAALSRDEIANLFDNYGK